MTCTPCLDGKHHRCRGCSCTMCATKKRQYITPKKGARVRTKAPRVSQDKATRNAQDRARRALGSSTPWRMTDADGNVYKVSVVGSLNGKPHMAMLEPL